MAFNMQKNNILRLLLLVLASLPLITSTNIDCKGNAFHCVNSTHFMICVDIGHGLSSTVDDFMIPCPMNTECRITNRFECEYPPIPSTTTLASTTVEIMDLATTVDQMETALFSEVKNVEHSTTVSPSTEINDLKDSVTTEQIGTSIIPESTQKISEDVMDQTMSPQMNKIYTEKDIKLSTTTSDNGVDVFTTVDPISITTSDTTFTEPVTQIVEITQMIDDSLTYSSQHDTTSISVVSDESLKDSISKDKDNVFVDVLTKYSSTRDIEVTTDVGFAPIDLAFAPNTELEATTNTLVNDIYKNTEAISTGTMTIITNAMENTLYTTKGDIIDNSVNDTATTESLVLSSEMEFSTDNTTADIRTTIFDISNMSSKNRVPADLNVIDFSTPLMNDFNSASTMDPMTTQDPTILLPSYTVPAITKKDSLAFSVKNVFYGMMESTQTENFITEENTQVNALVTENHISNTPSGTTISELPVNIVSEEYMEPRRYDGNDSTTEYTETAFTTKSIYNIVDDKSPQNITSDMSTTIFDVQNTENTSPKNVARKDKINTDPSKILMNSLFTTESITTLDLTTTEADNLPFSSKNDFYSTEATQASEIATKEGTQVNKLLIESHIFHHTNAPSATTIINELPVTIVGEDFTQQENYDDVITENPEKSLSTTSLSEGVTQNVEEISTKTTENTNIPSIITADQGLKPTEAFATTISHLFESHDQDLQTTEGLVSTLTIDSQRSLEPSNILSNGSQAQNTNVNLTNIDNEVAITSDMDLLLPIVANDIESATEFLNQVEINLSFYNSNLSRTLENLTLYDPAQVDQDKAEGKVSQTIEKHMEASLAAKVNTNTESIKSVNTTSDRENFTVTTTKLVSSSSTDESISIYNMLKTEEPEEKQIDKIFTSTVGDRPEADISSTTLTSISNVNYDTSSLVIPQVTSQELVTDPVNDKLSSKIPNKLSSLLTTNNMQIEKVTESFKSTLVSSVINEEININIDERITTSKALIETDSIGNEEGILRINNLGFTTEDHTTAQTTIQSLYDYTKYYDMVSTENYESITTENDIHTTMYESLNFGMVKTTELNVEKNIGTSSTKPVHNSKSEQDFEFEVGKLMVSTTMTSTQVEQVRNIAIPYTTTENMMEYETTMASTQDIKTEQVRNIVIPYTTTENIMVYDATMTTTRDIKTEQVRNIGIPYTATENIMEYNATMTNTQDIPIEQVRNLVIPYTMTENMMEYDGTMTSTQVIQKEQVRNIAIPYTTTENMMEYDATMTSTQGIQVEQVRNIAIPYTTTENMMEYETTMASTQDIKTEQVRNIVIPYTMTENIMEYDATMTSTQGIKTEQVRNIVIPYTTTENRMEYDAIITSTQDIQIEQVQNIGIPYTTTENMMKYDATMTSTQDSQIEQVRSKVIPYTTTKDMVQYDENNGNYAINIHEKTSRVKSSLQSINNIDTNILSTPFLTTTDKTNGNIDMLENENTEYLDYKVKIGVMESEDKTNILYSNEKNNGSKANVNSTVNIRQIETATYTTNRAYDTRMVSELTQTTTTDLNLSPAQNSTLQPDINIMEKDASMFLTQNEVTNNKNILTNIDINSQKNITQTSTKEKLDDYQIIGINENQEVAENIYHDNVDIAYSQNISNTITTSPIPKVILRVAPGKPVNQTVIETISEDYTESEIHRSVSRIQNMTHKINASYDISQNITTSIDEVKKLSSYTISSQTKSVSHQPTQGLKEVRSSGATISKLFEKDKIEKVNFDCLYRFRGRYADNENCRRFYICIGRQYPIVGMCPVDTVFSEFRKQCTNNLSHCVRNYVFYCTSEGRFSDIFNNNMYYICVKNNDNKFIRYKLQCENGYYLNKASYHCTPNAIVKPQSTLLESDKSQISSDTSVSLTNSNESRKIKKGDDLKCEKEGKFPDPNNCTKYYVCSKHKSSFKKKVKSCDSDEVFDKHKEKCVDAESYEC
ncbi:uncharacterized protein LOC115443939 isoform X1 [Manduca sexta]|uniref:uncharacterized protein LOC115443939 isoform X1 n=1 Tax=Manduca sexta TaxID=7130 RepID=UPI00118358B5|nr:uncharacterized protein LOC115443939 isoform X1 [Manduca sexta]